MRRSAYLLALASLAFAAVPPAAAALSPAEGHYAGETSNILLGPAHIQFYLRNHGGGTGKAEDFFCGCGVGGPWYAELDRDWFVAWSPEPATGAWVILQGDAETADRLSGAGGVEALWGTLRWTWSATRVPELGPAEADAEALAGLAEKAGELAGALDEGDADAPGGLAGAVGALSGRLVDDAERTARAEGLSRPAPYGAAADASATTEATVSRLERDATAVARRLRRRARALEGSLRRIAERARSAHPRRARRLRALARRIGRDLARLRREIGLSPAH